MMNRVQLIGRLTRDPELRYVAPKGDPVATFTLAVDRDYKNGDGERDADFPQIVAWRKTAETVAEYMTKGRLLALEGSVRTRSYEAKDGSRRYVTEIVADRVWFLDRAKNGDGNGHAPEAGVTDVPEAAAVGPEPEEIPA